MKQIPNIFTLLNLLLGCMALVCLLQPGITIQADEYALVKEKRHYQKHSCRLIMHRFEITCPSVYADCKALFDAAYEHFAHLQ